MLTIMKHMKCTCLNGNFHLLQGIFEYYDVKKNLSAMFHGTLCYRLSCSMVHYVIFDLTQQKSNIFTNS